MRFLGILAILLIAGCGTMVPLEELERQAMLTGDWSAVEKRERAIERRKAQQGAQCPVGFVSVCEGRIRIERCNCVPSGKIHSVIFSY